MTSPLTALPLDSLRHRRSKKWRAYPPDVLPLWVAEMDAPLAPAIQRVLSEAITRGDTGYADHGLLSEAFAGFAKERYGWQVDPAVPRLVADIGTAATAALRLVTRPGDAVVISTPVYPPFFEWIGALDRRVVASPLTRDPDGFRLDLDRLERDFAAGAAAYVLCNPHNPCGLVLTEAELLAVAELAERHDVCVLADEVHGPLTMPGVEHIPFARLPTAASARSFTLTSASKGWNLPGLKAALLIPGPQAPGDELPEELWAGAGLLGVLAGEVAFAESVEWLDELRGDIESNARLLAELLADRLPEVRYVRPRGTYLAWLDFTALDLGDDPAAVLLERGRVALSAGPRFGEEGKGCARLNLATTPAILTEAVNRIWRAVESVRSGSNGGGATAPGRNGRQVDAADAATIETGDAA